MRRIGRERWAEFLAEQARSGLSVAEFCRRKQLPQNSFYLWRRKLGGSPGSAGRASRAKRVRTGDVAFIPLTVVGAATVGIELPCGATIQVPGDEISLRRVLGVLLEAGAKSA